MTYVGILVDEHTSRLAYPNSHICTHCCYLMGKDKHGMSPNLLMVVFQGQGKTINHTGRNIMENYNFVKYYLKKQNLYNRKY